MERIRQNSCWSRGIRAREKQKRFGKQLRHDSFAEHRHVRNHLFDFGWGLVPLGARGNVGGCVVTGRTWVQDWKLLFLPPQVCQDLSHSAFIAPEVALVRRIPQSCLFDPSIPCPPAPWTVLLR